MNLAHIAVTVVAISMSLTLAPAATAAPGDTVPTKGTATSPDPKIEPILPEESTSPAVRKRETDTQSLYKRAGIAAPGRLRISGTDSRKEASLAANDPSATEPAAEPATTATGPLLPPGIKAHVDQSCSGDGTDGARVQAMYVREADQPDRYASVAPILRNEMRYMDDVVALSAMATGGGKRIRWVTDAACTLSVLNVVLPDGAITGPHSTTEKALRDAGYLKAQRKYLAFADVKMGGLGMMACGQGTVYNDPSPTSNLNDGRYPQMARIDLECWVTDSRYEAAPLHELLHTLGAVQPTAPHGGAGFHCSDGAEVMCYSDGSSTLEDICSPAEKFNIDCNHDDYFNTNPAPGSYLANNWNVAKSPFLQSVNTLPDPPSLTVTADIASPESGDLVTLTANVPAGTTVNWTSNVPECQNTGAPTTGTTYKVQCFNANPLEVVATASNENITTRSKTAFVTYRPGPGPLLVMSAPTSALSDTPFTVTANVTNAKSAWTYKWLLRQAGCTSANGTTSATLNVTCNPSIEGTNASFSVTATRTADGAVQSDNIGVKIMTPPAPTATVTGPTLVRAGTLTTFTSTVKNATSPTYFWSSQRGWGTGSTSGSSFLIQAPASVGADGTDTIYLTVVSSTGKRVSTSFNYSVENDLTMGMNGPSTLASGKTGTFVVTPSKASTIKWSDNQLNCALVPANADPKTSSLTCASDWEGVVTITATGTSGDETITRTMSVTVSIPPPPPVVTAHNTELYFSASAGYPTHMVIRLNDAQTGSALRNQDVQLESLTGTQSSFRVVKTLPTNSVGEVVLDIGITTAATYRVRYLGASGKYNAAVSTTRAMKVYTRLKNAKTSSGFKATLQTGSGRGVAAKKVVLQKRVVGTKKWVSVRTYTTTTTGTVTVKTNPRKRTDYRWVFKGTTTHRASKSGAVRLR